MRPRSWLSRFRRERGAREWSRVADGAAGLGAADRRSLQPEAHALRQDLNRFLQITRPSVRLSQAALDALPLPAGTDWQWRPGFLSRPLSPSGMVSPENGQVLGDQVTLWHDCAKRALILRQLPNAEVTALARYGMTLEVMGFTGGFLSLAVDLPADAMHGLSPAHVLRLETMLQPERPLPIYARLNITHGPNTEGILREIDMRGAGPQVVEFDLAGIELNENRLEKIWLDLIFEKPQMNAISIREFIVSRHPRANF
ncbi:DUF6478 family protein [Paracoccus sp. M683]|uniref:DUF6478 family protein n=1 Tax=Paracoccus sp. M683 TaxID=2594268 RepID=UPI002107C5B4|nr:DUF6478 family protein [Paracoccus sp. M683]